MSEVKIQSWYGHYNKNFALCLIMENEGRLYHENRFPLVKKQVYEIIAKPELKNILRKLSFKKIEKFESSLPEDFKIEIQYHSYLLNLRSKIFFKILYPNPMYKQHHRSLAKYKIVLTLCD